MFKIIKHIKTTRGATLIELIAAIVVVGIALAGMVNATSVLVSDSSSPLLRQQAIYIGQAYISEIINKPYRDPSSGSVCATVPATRASFDDVCDYRTLADTGAHDQFGTSISGLEDFDVYVDVTQTTLDGDDALRVDVSIEFDQGLQQLNLTAYRMEF